MGSQPAITEMATPVGSLELPEGLLEALTGSQVEERITRLTDLPFAVVGSILTRIPNPVDIASAFQASPLFWDASRSAPFRLQLRPSRYQDGGSFLGIGDDPGLPSRTGYDAQKSIAWTRAALAGIRCVMPSTQKLDLAGCPIQDDDVAAVLDDLRCLDGLVLDGCQKLTSSVTHALAVSVRSGPRVLSLQRCYRLGPAAAGNLLAAAAADGSRLQAILLSHLNKLELPREPPLLEPIGDGNCKEIGENVEVIKNVGSSSPGAGLRLLALHNCGSLGFSELVAISETCPYLEVLMLGGSVDGLRPSRPDMLHQERVMAAASALVGATELLPRLRILEITFCTASILQVVREQVSKGIYVWDFCDKNSVATAAAFVASLKGHAQPLGGEDDFGGLCENPTMACNNVHGYSESEICQSHKGDSDIEGVNVEEQFLSKTGAAQARYTHDRFDKRWDCVAEDVLMALRAGTNCSDMRRRTPLHVAAACGEPAVIASLLSLGAIAGRMKDSVGATALFVAAESGHAQVCDHLLRAGADVLASNRAGETPLYIAALRGHSAAVEVMLVHCQEHGINWQDADVNGDGYTPLMAAAVADRQDVGKVLLWGAGTTSNSALFKGQIDSEPKIFWEHGSRFDSKDVIPQRDNTSITSGASADEDKTGSRITVPRSAPQLLNAQNRYGQTALHISARRGSLWFVSNLLHAGASLDIRNEYGLRAVDIARKQSHITVEELLKQWEKHHMDVNDSQWGLANKRRSANKKQQGTRKKVPPGGNPNQKSSRHGVLSWVPKNSCIMKPVMGDVTPDRGSGTESPDSTLELELPSLPDSPTSIVPSWMHLSPPGSPRLEQLPAVTVEHRNINDVDGRGCVADIQPLLESEASQALDRVEGSQNYWRGRGIRQRTTPVDCNSSISSEDRQ